MRIVFVQSGLGTGGAEKIISILAKHRIGKGEEVHVIAMFCPAEGPYFEHPAEVTFHILDHGDIVPSRLLQWRRLKFLKQVLREIKPDILVSFLTKINVMSLLASIGRTYPVIISERNNPKLQGNNRLWFYINNYVSRLANRIVMLTERANKELAPVLKDKSVVICNPHDLPVGIRFKSKFQKRLVSVGRLQNQKGFDRLIGAFESVLPNHPEATLTIYGDGRDRGLLERQIKECGLERRVFLPGVTKKQAEWITLGDVFVLSSRHEGFANVVVEATAAGMPIVAFDCDFGPSEIIDHMTNGILVPNADIPALSKAISKLLSDEKLQKHFTGNYQLSRNRFASDKILRQWDRVIEDVSL